MCAAKLSKANEKAFLKSPMASKAKYGSAALRTPTNSSPRLKRLFTSTPSDSESGMDRYDSTAPYASSSNEDILYSTADPSDFEGSLTTSQEDLTTDNKESRGLLQAVVFIEDAIEHRSIHHKVDVKSLYRYRLYHSKPVRWSLRFIISILLGLAFLETPTSLKQSSDPRKGQARKELPCGLTESIELLCLVILTADLLFKFLMVGRKHAKKNPWLIFSAVVLIITYIDWFVSVGLVCEDRWRIRRLLRPFFLIQHSSLMKKTVQSIQQSIPQILSVLFLMCLHLYFFTMLGMVLFTPEDMLYNQTSISDTTSGKHRHSIDQLNDSNEGKAYFDDLGAAVMSLVVLLTTANNPDVMMPAYSDNRFYAIYFILFLAVGMYFFMNVLLAVIYNQFKGSFTKSMQSSFLRRRTGVRAAFEVLRRSSFYATPLASPGSCIDVSAVKALLDCVRFSKKSRYMPAMTEYLEALPTASLNSKQFQDLFDIVFEDSVKKRYPCRQFERPVLKQIQAILLHDYFQYFGDFMALVNVFVVTIELATSVNNAFAGHSMLSIFNFCFIFYFAIEQILMMYFIGPKRYFSHKNVWFESGVTWLLVIVEILCIAMYGGPFPYLTKQEIIERSQKYSFMSLYNLLRITNMLIIIRLLRIIPSIKPLSMVASTLVDLMKNMRAFGGIVILIYYVFAILGMMLFEGKSPQPPQNLTAYINEHNTSWCGSYEQLQYYANNFDDFAASLVILWDVMVVNNWFVFLHAYNKTTNSRYTQLYFVMWWLVSVVVCINLFVALVIEAFITQWDKTNLVKKKQHKKRKFAHTEETSRHFRVHEWFRAEYREPSEEEILKDIWSHHYLRRYTLLRPEQTMQD